MMSGPKSRRPVE